MEYVCWRRDNPFSDALDWAMYARTLELEA
jgi:hypothetical protein